MWHLSRRHDNHDRSTWLQSQANIKAGAANKQYDVIMDSLIEIGGINIPNQAISGEDCASLISTISVSIPISEVNLCHRACETIDRIIRSQDVPFQSRQLDSIISFLVENTARWTPPQEESGSPMKPSEKKYDQDEENAKAVTASALRALGCIVFENSDRCTRHYDTLIRSLLPFFSRPALAIYISSERRMNPTGEQDGMFSNLPVVSSTEDTLHASLVCIGNLILKTGSKLKSRHAELFPSLMRVLQWGCSLPQQTLPEVEMAGRVLSSALRCLVPILQIADSAVKDIYSRNSAELLRVLRDLSTFGWSCPALNTKRRLKKPDQVRDDDQGSGMRTPQRNRPSSSSLADSDASEHHSVTSRGSQRSNLSKWQLKLLHGEGASPVSSPVSSNSAAVSASPATQKGARGSAGSWYTVSDSDSDDLTQQSRQDGGDARARTRRLVPMRVRTTALQALQALARLNPRAVHAVWDLFIPQIQGTSRTPFQTSLLTVLLFDSSHRVQENAAETLASIVLGAPLSKWIALPAVSNSEKNNLSQSAPHAMEADSTTRRRAVTSFSEKISAMLSEVHLGLAEALQQLQSPISVVSDALSDLNMTNSNRNNTEPIPLFKHSKYPSLTVHVLKCVGNIVANTPYDRLRPGLSRPLWRHVFALVEVGNSAVSAAAIACLAAFLANPAALDDIDYVKPRKDLSKVRAAAESVSQKGRKSPSQLTFELLVLRVIGAPSGTPAPTEDAASSKAVTELQLHAPVRSEVITAISKACRSHHPLIVRNWTLLSKLLLSLFSDPLPPPRVLGLKLLEEVLLARASSISSFAHSSSNPTPTSTPSTNSSGNTSNIPLRRANNIDSVEEEHGEDAAPGGTGKVFSEGSARSIPASDWNILLHPAFSQLSSSVSTSSTSISSTEEVKSSSEGEVDVITIPLMLRSFLKSALRDVSPAVRAAACSCFGGILPQDWASAMFYDIIVVNVDLEDPFPDQLTTQSNACKISLRVLEPLSTAHLASAIQIRNTLLSLLCQASCDATPSARVAAARAWGVMLAFNCWKESPAFVRVVSRVLLKMLSDPNLSVRAKASWALGNLCSPANVSSVEAAAFVRAISSSSATYSTPNSNGNDNDPQMSGVVASLRRTLGLGFQCLSSTVERGSRDLGELSAIASDLVACHDSNRIFSLTLYHADSAEFDPELPLWLTSCPAAYLTVPGLDVAAAAPAGRPYSPSELFFPGYSQSPLCTLLSLDLLRAVTLAALQAAWEHDRVSCTAVRTLGYCVQALLLHWLPLPPNIRDYVNPVIISEGLSAGHNVGDFSASRDAELSSGRAKERELPKCPDDDLIKQAMLTLADIIAATAISSNSNSSSSSTNISASSTNATSSTSNAAPGSNVLASQKWVDVDDNVDVREFISRRRLAPALRNMPLESNDTEKEKEMSEDDGGEFIPVPSSNSTPSSKVKSPSHSSNSKFKFSNRKKTNSDRLNWRSSSSPQPQNPPQPSENEGNSLEELREKKLHAVSSANRSSVVASPFTNVNGGNEEETEGAGAGSFMKVRWNACHAVRQILPLAQRIVTTHPVSSTRIHTHLSELEESSVSSDTPQLTISQTVTTNVSAIPEENEDDHTIASSPSRPRVRRDFTNGLPTALAGVQHLSTAQSPFLPKSVNILHQSLNSMSPNYNPSGVESPSESGPSTPLRKLLVRNQLSSAAGTFPRTDVVAENEEFPTLSSPTNIHLTNRTISHPHVSHLNSPILTDSTEPTVTIDISWMPPLLVALQSSLSSCKNFKVRIAAAYSIATIPSRESYRIPTIGSAPFAAAAGGNPLGTTGPTTSNSHTQRHLQAPGFDAFPMTVEGLLHSLLASEITTELSEYLYKDTLKAAIRVALIHTLLLSVNGDYGYMKAFFDANVASLWHWLQSEEKILKIFGPNSNSDTNNLESESSNNASTGDVFPSEKMNGGEEKDTTKGDTEYNVESLVQYHETPSFGTLEPVDAITLERVNACYLKLNSLFRSRIKSVPPEFLKKFKEKAVSIQSSASN